MLCVYCYRKCYQVDYVGLFPTRAFPDTERAQVLLFFLRGRLSPCNLYHQYHGHQLTCFSTRMFPSQYQKGKMRSQIYSTDFEKKKKNNWHCLPIKTRYGTVRRPLWVPYVCVSPVYMADKLFINMPHTNKKLKKPSRVEYIINVNHRRENIFAPNAGDASEHLGGNICLSQYKWGIS